MRYLHTLLSIWAFPVRYLAEKPLRATYLILTLLLAFTSYTLLIMLGLPFAPNDTPKITNAGVIGIGASYGSLPARYAREIARLSGIESVQYGDFMPVQCQTGITATLNGMAGIGASPIPNITQSLKPTELQSWRNGFNGMLVGDALAKRCHWHTGELLTLQGEMGAQPTIKVRIIAIYHVGAENPALNQIAVVHYRYLNGLNPADKQGSVMWMSAKAADPRQAARLATIIDIHFANSSPPTESSASAAGQGALAQFGNVLKIVEFVMAAVFACALLVTANVAAHAAAERRSQFALLRVLGFSRSWLVLLATIELLYVSVIGCGLGLALGLTLLHWVIKPLLVSWLPGLFTVPASTLALAPAIAAGIVLISALIPAWEVFRLRGARLSAP